MTKVTTLFENKWNSIKQIETDRNGTYVHSSKPWCNSAGVAVLPYRKKEDG